MQLNRLICRRFSTSHYLKKPVKLSYDKFSSPVTNKKPSIILLHGLFGNKLNNRGISLKLFELFEKNRDIYLLDLRNHGNSPRAKPHDYITMSEDVDSFMETHNLQDCILIGHSMGGKVVMQMMLNKDINQKIELGVCIENAPIVTMPNQKFLTYIQALTTTQNSNLQTRTEIKNQLNKLLTNESQLIKNFLMTLIDNKGNPKLPLDILKESIVKGNISAFPVPQNSITNKPILFIRSDNSNYIPDDYILPLSNHFTNFEIKTIKDSTHFVNTEKPFECAELIYDYITKKED